jgi:hypothetical protein
VLVGLRGGVLREHITMVDWTAEGSIVGGLVGAQWSFGRRLALELQASETAVRLGNRTTDMGVSPNSAVRGSSFGVQVGFLARL